MRTKDPKVRDRLIEKMSVLKTKADWKKYTQDLLLHNDVAVVRALMLLYSFQSDREKSQARTIDANGKGFDSVDAPILTRLAKKVEAGEMLSADQIELARQRILKYHEQITNVSKHNLGLMKEEQAAEIAAKEQCCQMQLQLGC